MLLTRPEAPEHTPRASNMTAVASPSCSLFTSLSNVRAAKAPEIPLPTIATSAAPGISALDPVVLRELVLISCAQ